MYFSFFMLTKIYSIRNSQKLGNKMEIDTGFKAQKREISKADEQKNLKKKNSEGVQKKKWLIEMWKFIKTAVDKASELINY